MKKIVFILALLTLTSTAFAVENNVVVSPVKATEIQKQHQERINRDIAFEKRLGLTEVQKLKAREKTLCALRIGVGTAVHFWFLFRFVLKAKVAFCSLLIALLRLSLSLLSLFKLERVRELHLLDNALDE